MSCKSGGRADLLSFVVGMPLQESWRYLFHGRGLRGGEMFRRFYAGWCRMVELLSVCLMSMGSGCKQRVSRFHLLLLLNLILRLMLLFYDFPLRELGGRRGRIIILILVRVRHEGP